MSQQQPAAAGQTYLRQHLPQLILLLFIAQPGMDVLSYWLDALGGGNTVSLLLRFAMLAGTALVGFGLSRNRKIYFALCAVLMLLAAGHIWACGTAGYSDPVYDLTNYIRVAQIPLFVFCFVTFLREGGEDSYRAIERGFAVNFVMIVAVELLSAATGTNPYTYPNKSIGLLGWFYFANSQSAILSALVPVLLMQAIRAKKTLCTVAAAVASFGVLYLFATRLAYLAIFVSAAGLILVILLCRRLDKKAAAILLAGAVICGAGYFVSPMYRNQAEHQDIVREKQQRADEMIAQAEEEYGTTVEQSPELCLLPVYEEHLGGLVDRFGAARVMQQYGYSRDAERLSGWREMKITYCRLLMEDTGLPAVLFGMELSDMTWDGETYDVENDFHGIFYLYGAVGLAAFILFLLYFAWLIVRAMLRDFSRYFTLEAGAFGISLCLLLVHVYCTAGVVRRPNASFYLSVVLAVIYYFVKIKAYSAEQEELPPA